jgi:hypothetical protein
VARKPVVAKGSAAVLLKLDGIVWGNVGFRAIINGKAVKVGDHVSGFEIMEITKAGVKVNANGESEMLTQKKAQTA